MFCKSVLLALALIGTKNLVYAMTPEAVFKDKDNYWENSTGKQVRKGSIGAMLANIKVISTQKLTKDQYLEITGVLYSLIPSLEALGIFEHFPKEYWLKGKKSGRTIEGHLLLGVLLTDYLKTSLTFNEEEEMVKNSKNCHEVLQNLVNSLISKKELAIEVPQDPAFAITPKKLLKDGADFGQFSLASTEKITIRKGSLKAFLSNVETIQQCQTKPNDVLSNEAFKNFNQLLEAAYHLNFLRLYDIDDFSIFKFGKYGSAYKILQPNIKNYLASKYPSKQKSFFARIKDFFLGMLKCIA